jgi:hypothetical protein
LHTAKSLKAKNSYSIFIQQRKLQKKKKALACILALITSLLKSRELGQYFKKIQKIFCFVLMSEITNLYVKRIPDIQKIFLL